MPTKTKPKAAAWAMPFVVRVQLRQKDRGPLCDACGLQRTGPPADRLLAAVEQVLTPAFNHLRAAWERPAPAHLAAELEPIAKAARDLAARLQPLRASTGVLDALAHPAIDSGEASTMLAEIAVAADRAIQSLKAERGRGAHHRQRTEAIEQVTETFRRLFQEHATPEAQADPDNLSEFVARCMRYMPKSPGTPGRKPKPAK